MVSLARAPLESLGLRVEGVGFRTMVSLARAPLESQALSLDV